MFKVITSAGYLGCGVSFSQGCHSSLWDLPRQSVCCSGLWDRTNWSVTNYKRKECMHTQKHDPAIYTACAELNH